MITTSDQGSFREITECLQDAALETDFAETYAQAVSLYTRFHYVLAILVSAVSEHDTT